MRFMIEMSMMRLLLVTSALAASACALADSAPGEFQDRWRAVAGNFRTLARQEQTAGASLYFLHEGKTIAAEHFGVIDLKDGREVDRDTIYHWASITKTFTAVAVLQLRDRGLLSLDDPVVRYLPEIRKVHNPYGSMEDITLRHLITHSSGFRAATFPWGKGETWYPHEPAEWSQVAAMMPYTEILFEPGTKCSYSNPAISMLGRIVEIVTGDDVEVYITKNILMPLGMTRSYFDITPYFLREHRSNNYFVREGEPEAQGRELDTGATTANGGLNGPVDDMAKWVNFLAGTGSSTNRHHVLSAESLAEMRRPVCSINVGDELDPSMGMAIFSMSVSQPGSKPPITLYGHTGGQKAYNSFIYFDPASKAAVIYASNTRNLEFLGDESLFWKVRTQVFSTIFPLFQ